MPQTQIVLHRDHKVGKWIVNTDGILTVTEHAVSEKAGDVARVIQKANPDARMGIKSVEFGPATMTFGDIVWLKEGWMNL